MAYPNAPKYNILLNENSVPNIAPNIVEEPRNNFIFSVLEVLSIIFNKMDEEIVNKTKGKNNNNDIVGFLKVIVKVNPKIKCSMKNAKMWFFLYLDFNSFLVLICL